MIHLIGRLANLGTSNQKDSARNQIIRLVNKIVFFVILLLVPHFLMDVAFQCFLPAMLQLITMTALGFVIFLNSRFYFNSARVLALLIGNFHIVGMVFILGLGCGVHYYFPAAIIAPLLLFTFKEVRFIVFFVVLTILLALFVQCMPAFSSPLVQQHPLLETLFFYYATVGSLVIVFLFVLHFYIELSKARNEVKILSGFLPICSHCKKIRDDKGYWTQVEAYIRNHSEAQFTHGICPECAKKFYPEYY